MVEVSGGRQLMPNGSVREATNIQVTFQGQVFEGDIGAGMRQRYVDDDPYLRSILEYGEVEHSTDADGNTVKTFVPKGIDGSAVISANDPDLLARAQEAEARAAALQKQVDDLSVEAARAADEIVGLREQVAEWEAQTGSTLSLDDLSTEALQAEADKRKLEVVGTGSTGNVLKKDLVKALEEARASH